MANVARVVCWKDREEWTHVYRNLYSFDNADLQKKGIARVLAWKSRSGGKLPLAVESTANLVSALLTDNSTTCFSYQIQLTTSMALVRFVNGITDTNQKGVYARSVQSIAEELGLPDWMVDLRHEATHAALPSRQTLRAGIIVALEWLEEEYWKAQIKMHKNAEEKLPALLMKYRDNMLNCLGKKKRKKIGQISGERSQEIVTLVTSNSLWPDLPDCLIDLLPSTSGLDLPEKDDTKTEKEKYFLPNELVIIWRPLLVALNQGSAEFIPSFLIFIIESLTSQMQHQESSIIDCLVGWAKWLINQCSLPNKVLTCEMPWLAVLDILLLKPSMSSKTLLEPVLKQLPAVSETLKQQIRKCYDIYFGASMEKSPSGQLIDSKFLQDIVERKKHKNNGKMAHNQLQQPSGWSNCHGNTEWHLISFGEILGINDKSSDCLELEPLQSVAMATEGEERSFLLGSNTQETEPSCGEVCLQTELLGFDNFPEPANTDAESMDISNMDLEELQNQIVLF